MIQAAQQVSAIICAYTEDRWDSLVEAVASLRQQSMPPYEIIVVIDHNPRLLERVQAQIPGIIAIANGGPHGLSGARNSGRARAQGTLIAYLDDDAVAEPDWLAHLAGCCTDSQVLGAGGTVEPLWIDQKPAWFPEEFYWVVGCTYRGLPEQRSVVRNAFGGCICFRRDIFEAVGGFIDGIGRVDTIPLGCEETELCIRAKQHWPQKVFLHEPQARTHHRVPPQRGRLRYFLSRCYAEGLSKAIVSGYVGTKDGLASERSYTLRTLPKGIAHGIAVGLFRGDLAGFLRAGAIMLGVGVTTAGYLVGSIVQGSSSHREVNNGAQSSFTSSTPAES